MEGVDNHNRMQAQRSLRKVAEKGVRLKGDTIMLFRLSGELPIMGSWHGMIKTRRRCVRLVEDCHLIDCARRRYATLLLWRTYGTLFFFLGARVYQSVVPNGTFSARQGEQLKTALKAQKNESWRVALSGRWICCLQQYPRRRYACLGLCVDYPFGAFFSNQNIHFFGIHLGSFG